MEPAACLAAFETEPENFWLGVLHDDFWSINNLHYQAHPWTLWGFSHYHCQRSYSLIGSIGPKLSIYFYLKERVLINCAVELFVGGRGYGVVIRLTICQAWLYLLRVIISLRLFLHNLVGIEYVWLKQACDFSNVGWLELLSINASINFKV